MVPTMVAAVTWALATDASGNAMRMASSATMNVVFLITAHPSFENPGRQGAGAALLSYVGTI
jgi:hypothetical protein